jgi:hypothetical protein
LAAFAWATLASPQTPENVKATATVLNTAAQNFIVVVLQAVKNR